VERITTNPTLRSLAIPDSGGDTWMRGYCSLKACCLWRCNGERRYSITWRDKSVVAKCNPGRCVFRCHLRHRPRSDRSAPGWATHCNWAATRLPERQSVCRTVRCQSTLSRVTRVEHFIFFGACGVRRHEREHAPRQYQGASAYELKAHCARMPTRRQCRRNFTASPAN
jgi:hypothetical protein